MRIAGHTMGTPNMDVDNAIVFFAGIGLDGVDLICADDYRCAVPLDMTDAEVRRLRDLLARAGLELANLTPYAKRLNAADPTERANNVDIMSKAIRLAARLGCPSLRLWSGDIVPGEDVRASFEFAVTSIVQVAKLAGDYGITLNLENHVHTLTPTIRDVLAMLEAVNSTAVRALLDPACLVMHPGAETGTQAIGMLGPRLALVHVKDVKIQVTGRVIHVPVGQGDTGWARLLKALREAGYTGYLSLEYERRWHPDMLPAPEIGMAESLRFLRSTLRRLDGGMRD